jgi:hypothetical protein
LGTKLHIVTVFQLSRHSNGIIGFSRDDHTDHSALVGRRELGWSSTLALLRILSTIYTHFAYCEVTDAQRRCDLPQREAGVDQRNDVVASFFEMRFIVGRSGEETGKKFVARARSAGAPFL